MVKTTDRHSKWKLPEDKRELLVLLSEIHHRSYFGSDLNQDPAIEQMQKDLQTLSLAIMVLLHPDGVR